MKKIVYLFVTFFILLVSSSSLFANGSMNGYAMSQAKDGSAKSHVMRYQKNLHAHSARLRQHGGNRFIVYPGSLRNNIERLAAQHGWRVVKWDAQTDFNWAGNKTGTRVQATNLQGALRKILKKYPVQAQFYLGNHVLAIAPRTLK